jgi:DNA polymerase-3 subunit gamma/tau
MSASPHASLYRAYRPTTFAEIVGQESIVETLQEQVKQGTVGHAYLFAGSRGLGKTSIARIFAQALGTKGTDLYEIDAASNNSVDDIRALTENVYTLPFESPYKIYLLDEAHMLSKSAWNAFLKTLEEPPAHAIFILATTELDKVPETVQSRCQVFTFKKPTRQALQKMVLDIAAKEGFSIDAGAVDLIALLSGGSYRDALSVLQRILGSTSGKKISREDAEKATGAPPSELLENFVAGISEDSIEKSLQALKKAEGQNISLPTFLLLVLEDVRAVLLIRHAPELRKEIEQEIGVEKYTVFDALAKETNTRLTHTALKHLLDASDRVRFSPVPALPLELALYDIFA